MQRPLTADWKLQLILIAVQFVAICRGKCGGKVQRHILFCIQLSACSRLHNRLPCVCDRVIKYYYILCESEKRNSLRSFPCNLLRFYWLTQYLHTPPFLWCLYTCTFAVNLLKICMQICTRCTLAYNYAGENSNEPSWGTDPFSANFATKCKGKLALA